MEPNPEQPRGLEPAQPVSPEVIAGRGGERFNWKMAGICLVGGQIGGAIVERASLILTADQLGYGSSNALSMLAFMVGATVFGFFVPVEIHRRATHRTWHDVWNRLTS